MVTLKAIKMEEKSWAVIKFPHENDAVAAVPISWLNGNTCYWPPWSQDRVAKAIKNSTVPETTWQSHPFLPLRNNVFDNYNTAVKKSEMAMKNSDLESQSESSFTKIGNVGSLKRRKIKTKLTKFASFEVMEQDSSDETNDTSPFKSSVSEPPKISGDGKRFEKRNISPSLNSALSFDDPLSSVSQEGDENIGATYPAELEKTGDKKRKYPEKNVSSGSLTFLSQEDCNFGTTTPSAESENTSENTVGDEKRKIIEKTRPLTSLSQGDFGATSSSELANKTGSTELQNIAEYLKKIVRKQNIIQSTLMEVAEDVNELKNYIKHKKTEQQEERMSIFNILKLPVETQEELDELEQFLSTDTQLKSAVKEISSSGGKDVYDLIYRATCKLITNGFASGFSYYGKKKKMKFSSLKLNKLLIDSAVNTFDCTEKEAELAVSKWLRRCAERARNETN